MIFFWGEGGGGGGSITPSWISLPTGEGVEDAFEIGLLDHPSNHAKFGASCSGFREESGVDRQK